MYLPPTAAWLRAARALAVSVADGLGGRGLGGGSPSGGGLGGVGLGGVGLARGERRGIQVGPDHMGGGGGGGG